jgi:hypothetical protein
MPMEFLLFLTAVLRVLAYSLDNPKSDSVTTDAILRRISDGTLLEFFLELDGGDSMDLSYLRDKDIYAKWYLAELKTWSSAFEDRERRKLGLENNRGLPYLLSLTAEILQHPDRMDLTIEH